LSVGHDQDHPHHRAAAEDERASEPVSSGTVRERFAKAVAGNPRFREAPKKPGLTVTIVGAKP
jgi:hypothetical protein